MDFNFPAKIHVIDGVRSHLEAFQDHRLMQNEKKYAAGQGDRTHAKCGQKFSKCVENFPSVWKINFLNTWKIFLTLAEFS